MAPPPAREFKILSVDGGGMKGLYSAAVLQQIETGNGCLTDHFDMLCGTSTGGLIVLALAAGKPAADIVAFYQQWGPRIFPRPLLHRKAYRFLRLLACKSRYGDRVLKQAAQHILGDARVKDANSYLCIPAFSRTRSVPRVFKTDHAPGLSRDSELLLSEVAVATAAAPSYFPVAVCDEGTGAAHYIDGGVWANNPALVGLTEALTVFAGSGRPYDAVRVLSVGNVASPPGREATNRREMSLLAFGSELLEAVMEAQQRSTDYFIANLIPSLSVPVKYVRIPSHPLSASHSRHIGLDGATGLAIPTLIELGATTGHEWKAKPEIRAFFTSQAAPPIHPICPI